MNDLSAIVLAGGRGERMRSNLPKVLHKLNGKPLIFWTLELLGKLGVEKTVLVTGYQSSVVKDAVSRNGFNVAFTKQRKPLGTANAVKIGLKKIPKRLKNVLVIYGDDSCLYKPITLRKMINRHQKEKN